MKTISIIVPLSVAIEVMLSKNITGFELRYYYHWVLLIPLLIILPLDILPRTRKKPIIVSIIMIPYILLLACSAGSVSLNNIRRIYEPDFVPGYIRNYAMHRINLEEWIDYHFPQMNDFIRWCGERRPMQDITVLDPPLIWFSYEGMMRVFMVNCRITGGKSSYIVSETRCLDGKPSVTTDSDHTMQKYHEINQKLICKSKEIFKNLYSNSEDR